MHIIQIFKQRITKINNISISGASEFSLQISNICPTVRQHWYVISNLSLLRMSLYSQAFIILFFIPSFTTRLSTITFLLSVFLCCSLFFLLSTVTTYCYANIEIHHLGENTHILNVYTLVCTCMCVCVSKTIWSTPLCLNTKNFSDILLDKVLSLGNPCIWLP